MANLLSFVTFLGKFLASKQELYFNKKKPFIGIASLALAMPQLPLKNCPGGCKGWQLS